MGGGGGCLTAAPEFGGKVRLKLNQNSQVRDDELGPTSSEGYFVGRMGGPVGESWDFEQGIRPAVTINRVGARRRWG